MRLRDVLMHLSGLRRYQVGTIIGADDAIRGEFEMIGAKVRAVEVSEGIGRVEIRILLPWLSWPWALFPSVQKRMMASARRAVELVRPVGIIIDVTSIGWRRHNA
jgi:hypothetical protein